jgi:hypothetical protein
MGILLLTRLYQIPEVEIFHFGTSPGGAAQKVETRLDTGVALEAINFDVLTQILPPVMFHKNRKDLF